MDYESILDQSVDEELSEYEIEAKDAFAFQQVLRAFGKRTYVRGRALRGGVIAYTAANTDK